MPESRIQSLGQRTALGMRAALRTVAVSTMLAVLKIASGIIGRSYALIADGVESLLDILGSLIVWSGLRIASRPPDRNHPYGHGKAESLAAVVVALVLLAAGIGLAVQSVRTILTPHRGPAAFTLIVLVVVVVIKEGLYRRLARTGLEIESRALEADAWHHRSDALTSIAAFLGISIALIGGEGYESADGWAALVACAIIGFNGVRLLKNAVGEVMDEAPPDDFSAAIRRAAGAVEGVIAVEKVLARKSGPGWLVDIHVEVDGTLSVSDGHEIGHRVKDALVLSRLKILDALVHVEPVRLGE